MKNKKMNLKTLKEYYYQYIHWSIILYIKCIRQNKFPYQLDYWKKELKEALILRNKKALEIINYYEPKQLIIKF